MKTCNKCNTEKPLSEFYKHPETKDGRLGQCKPCHKAAGSKWRAANKALAAEHSRRWHAAHPERKAYLDHRGNAKKRGIAWGFTYETWRAKWGDRFEQRGRRRVDQLVMARRGDKGPYSPENVVIITASMNLKHGHKRQKLAKLREAS